MSMKLGAKADIRLDASSNTDSISRIWRRSIRPAPSIIPGAEMAAITPGVVTISPAVPGVTPRSRAICGNRPTGKNSVVTNAKAPIVTDPTASQERNGDTSPFSGEGWPAG